MAKLPISVCIVSGAEAHRIGNALESVVDWVNEIIVVLDDRTTDGTEAVVEQYGGKVFREPWKGFAGQKNSATEKAVQPWVLGLDADEAVSAELKAEVQRLFAREPEGPNGYSFPRCSFYFGRWIRHGDWYPDRCTRLWKRDRGRWVGEDPHARPEVDGPVGRLKGDLLHYTTETFERQIAKTIAYADDFARECRRNGRRIHRLQLYARPAFRFIRGYFLRLGFLDGWQGYSIAWMTAFYTFLRYGKAYVDQQDEPE